MTGRCGSILGRSSVLDYKVIELAPANKEGNSIVYLQVQHLQGRKLHTLSQNKAFDVRSVTAEGVRVFVHESGKERRIPISEIQPAWDYLQKHGVLTLLDVRQKGFSEVSPAYVVSILTALPDVSHGKERRGDGGRPVVTLRYGAG